jgi:hypothetical protein
MSILLGGLMTLTAGIGCTASDIQDAWHCDGDEFKTPAKLEFSQPSVTLVVGESVIVLSSAVDSRGSWILCYHGTQQRVSTNPAVFTAESGPLIGVAPGSAFLKVTLGTLVDSIPVTVTSKP